MVVGQHIRLNWHCGRKWWRRNLILIFHKLHMWMGSKMAGTVLRGRQRNRLIQKRERRKDEIKVFPSFVQVQDWKFCCGQKRWLTVRFASFRSWWPIFVARVWFFGRFCRQFCFPDVCHWVIIVDITLFQCFYSLFAHTTACITHAMR